MNQEDKISELEMKTTLIHNDLKSHIDDQHEINETLKDMLGEIKLTVYGEKNHPEDGLVYQSRQCSKYIEKKLSGKSEIINYVYRSIILILILWVVKNMVNIATFIQGLSK